MFDASFLVGTDLNGVLVAEEKRLDLVTFTAELGEVFSNEVSVVEAASADVFIDGGEGDDDDVAFELGEDGIEKFGKGLGGGTNALVFEIMNELAERTRTFADDVNRWELFRFTFGASIRMRFKYVFFTTIAKNASGTAATPTGVGREKV